MDVIVCEQRVLFVHTICYSNECRQNEALIYEEIHCDRFLVRVVGRSGWCVNWSTKQSTVPQISQSNIESVYPLLSKRIFTNNQNDILINFTDLRNQVRNYVGQQKATIGLYFEYLPTGLSVGVNDTSQFYRASLVKLPVVMRAYKLVEQGKIDKDETLAITERDIDKTYGDLWKQNRTEISFREAVKLSLTVSDNTAFRIINHRVDRETQDSGGEVEQAIADVYKYLDVPLSSDGASLFISPKNYSSILKSLYFSAYLSYQSSSELLGILSQSEFTDWIPAPIPDDIIVAHKTGTSDSPDDQNRGLAVLTDCGIIYYPDRPYLLCIMVSSSSIEESLTYIRSLSLMVYDYIDGIGK